MTDFKYITVDFETRCALNIKTVGAWKYSRDVSCDVINFGFELDELPCVWDPILAPGREEMEYMFEELKDPNTRILAYNSFFEYSVWNNVAVRRYGFPEMPVEKFVCLKAIANANGFFGKLDEVLERAKLSVRKDSQGMKLIKALSEPKKFDTLECLVKYYKHILRYEKFCDEDIYNMAVISRSLNLNKPLLLQAVTACDYVKKEVGTAQLVKGTKASIQSALKSVYLKLSIDIAGLTFSHDIYERTITVKKRGNKNPVCIIPPEYTGFKFNDDLELRKEMLGYVRQDVVAERKLFDYLVPMREADIKMFHISESINTGGMHVDVPAVNACLDLIEEETKILDQQVNDITGGKLASARSPKAICEWLTDQGIEGAVDLTKATVRDLLMTLDPNDDAYKILKIRQQSGRSSTKKIYALSSMVDTDDRIRGLYIFNGAVTGRWTSQLLQSQNISKPIKGIEDYELLIQLLKEKDRDKLIMMYGNVFDAVASSIRSLIIPRPGHVLSVYDFASIEGMGACHMAHDWDGLQVYKEKKSPYIVLAASIFGKKYEDIVKGSPEYDLGKMGELLLTYQGSNREPNYTFCTSAKTMFGTDVSIEMGDEIVRIWREVQHPAMVEFWYMLQDAFREAIFNPGYIKQAYEIQFCKKGDHVHARLPNGRIIIYPFAEFVSKAYTQDVYGRSGIRYRGFEKTSTGGRVWGWVYLWGGKIFENMNQGNCTRDITAAAIQRVHNHKHLNVVLHTHDEAGAEMPEGADAEQDMIKLMEQNEPWNDGMPIRVEGGVVSRYRKM